MKRTPGLAGTATGRDYNSQRAVRQIQVEVRLLGMLGFVVSAVFHNLGSLEDLELLFLAYLAVLTNVVAEDCRAYLRS